MTLERHVIRGILRDDMHHSIFLRAFRYAYNKFSTRAARAYTLTHICKSLDADQTKAHLYRNMNKSSLPSSVVSSIHAANLIVRKCSHGIPTRCVDESLSMVSNILPSYLTYNYTWQPMQYYQKAWWSDCCELPPITTHGNRYILWFFLFQTVVNFHLLALLPCFSWQK